MGRLAIMAAIIFLMVGCGSGGSSGEVSSIPPGPGGDPGGTVDPGGGTDPGEAAALSAPDAPFAERYEDLIPPDVAVDVYDPKRFALVTGIVQDAGGSPLPGVRVALAARYGSVTTDAEGRFTIPTEGGGAQTLSYSKAGLISSHRQVRVPWNDTTIAETVRMIPQDAAATTLAFDGNPSTIVSHRSTPVSDDFGSRSATMVFAGDNKAYEVDEEGNTVRELTSITTRATEFTTPETMPAALPPNSAYTYCVEMSVDGAKRVRFDKPVVSWVENFLGFEVGEAVPVGYYDRDRGLWVPSENGVVVRLLDIDSDGAVDALDADGNGLPDDLDGDGAFEDEVAGLSDPALYPTDATFWRFSVTHFTPWDCNWPYGPPEDATDPNPEEEPEADEQKEEEKPKPCGGKSKISSFVEDRSRVFHEDIPLPGTDLALHYASNRTEGYKTAIRVPASAETVPESLEAILVKVEVAGRSFEKRLPPEPNQVETFPWDGLDHLGRPVAGLVTAHVSVGFVYKGIYYSAEDRARAFANFGRDATGVRTRQEVTLWRRWNLVVRPGAGAGTLAEGWTLSPHHYTDLSDLGTLLKGDGTTLVQKHGVLETVLGTGSWGEGKDGAPVARRGFPMGSVIDATGNLYFAEATNPYGEMGGCDLVWKRSAEGLVTPVAGDECGNFFDSIENERSDGSQAVGTYFSDIYDIALDAAGNLYLLSSGLEVWKVSTNGILTVVAGTNSSCYVDGEHIDYSGDGGPALEACFYDSRAIAVDAAGNLYIMHSGNSRVRKVDSAGIVTTVAGNGTRGLSGDGGPAIDAQLYYGTEIALDAEGNLYLASSDQIRKVSAAGIITTVVGNGVYIYSWEDCEDCGDGGPAIDADIESVDSMAFDATGNLYFSEASAHRIRKVDTNGIITTVVGTGTKGYSGDGTPADNARITYPDYLAVDAAGDLYFNESGGNTFPSTLRKITFSAPSVYDASGEIFFTEEGLGYFLSSEGRHQKTIDLDTGATLREFAYDEVGNLIGDIDRFGNLTRLEWAGGVPTAVVSPEGLTTNLSVDADNRLTRVSYPDGSGFSFGYSSDGLMTAETDPAGNRFGHVFDEIGRLNDVTDPEGGHWTFEKQAAADGGVLIRKTTGEGDVTTYLERTDLAGAYTSTVTGPSGGQSVFTRSADKLSATRSLSCGTEVSSRYGRDPKYHFPFAEEVVRSIPSGLAKETLRDKGYQDSDGDDLPDLITETVTVNGRATTLVTDTQQATKEVTSPSGRKVTTFYDPQTLLTSRMTVPGLYDLDYGYDARGRLTFLGQDARRTAFTFNAQGFLDSVTDPENRTTTYDHDAMGRVTGIHRPDSSLARFTYDKNGNMTMLTNPSGVDHGFNYNGVDGTSGYQTPKSGSYSYLYDRDRRLTQIHFPSGRTIKNFYSQGRLDAIETPEGTVNYSYLCATKVGSVSKGGESLTYSYDGPLVTSETSSGILNQSLSYAYNNDFDITTFTYAGGTENYSYDNDGLLTGAGSFTLTRNAGNGLPESVSDGPFSLDRTFNGFGEVEGEAVTVGVAKPYAYNLVRDSAGRIVEKTETTGGTSVRQLYTYDSMGRLLTVTRDGVLVEEYRYNANGSRTYEMNSLRGVAGRTLSYDEEDRLLTAGDTSYQFDLDGFLTSKTRDSEIGRYSYSSRGELLSVNLPDGKAIEYIHDPQGRRIAKKVNGSIIEKYLWQGLTRLLAVYDGSDNLLMRFAYADGRMPVSMTKGGTTYYLAYDQVGTLRLVLDSSGNVVKRGEYDSFGNMLSDSNSSFTVPFGFAGGLHDRDTGLVRFGYRDYAPETGRWTAKDPIEFESGATELYGYVFNDPINWIDSDGLMAIASGVSIGGMLGGPAGAAVGAVIGAIAGIFIGDFIWDKVSENNIANSKACDLGDPKKHGKNKKPENPNKPKGAEGRQKKDGRERNVGHPKGEEHSRIPKGGPRSR